jgi:hypothetical protein
MRATSSVTNTLVQGERGERRWQCACLSAAAAAACACMQNIVCRRRLAAGSQQAPSAAATTGMNPGRMFIDRQQKCTNKQAAAAAAAKALPQLTWRSVRDAVVPGRSCCACSCCLPALAPPELPPGPGGATGRSLPGDCWRLRQQEGCRMCSLRGVAGLALPQIWAHKASNNDLVKQHENTPAAAAAAADDDDGQAGVGKRCSSLTRNAPLHTQAACQRCASLGDCSQCISFIRGYIVTGSP